MMLDPYMGFYLILFFVLLLVASIAIFLLKKEQYVKHDVVLFIFKLGIIATFIISVILILSNTSSDGNIFPSTFTDFTLIIIEITVSVFITLSILYYEHTGKNIIKEQINTMNSYQTNKQKNDNIRKSKVDTTISTMLEIMLKNLKHEKNLLFNFYELEIPSNSQKIDPEFIHLRKNNSLLHVENLKNIILINHDVIDSDRNLALLEIITIASESYMLHPKYQDYDINTITREIQNLQIVLTKDYGKNIRSSPI